LDRYREYGSKTKSKEVKFCTYSGLKSTFVSLSADRNEDGINDGKESVETHGATLFIFKEGGGRRQKWPERPPHSARGEDMMLRYWAKPASTTVNRTKHGKKGGLGIEDKKAAQKKEKETPGSFEEERLRREKQPHIRTLKIGPQSA